MCEHCYADLGFPVVLNDNVFDIAVTIHQNRYRNFFHVVIDDWNLQDETIEQCIEQNDCDGELREFGERLLSMSIGERATSLALADSIIKISTSNIADHQGWWVSFNDYGQASRVLFVPHDRCPSGFETK